MIATWHKRDPPERAEGIGWLAVDLRERGAIEVAGELGAIIHLAAQLPRPGESNERQSVANRAIDKSVLECAARACVPVVYASTGALYAEPVPASGWSEQGPITPSGPYLEEKAWAEAYGFTLAKQTGMSFTALRINAPYGPEQSTRTVMTLFVDQALAGGPLTYLGTGSREQDFSYVDDVADACIAALDAPAGTFNVAGGESVTMRGLAELVAHAAGLGRDTVVAAGRPDPQEGRRAVFDLERSATRLGWTPRVSLADGIARCLARGTSA